MADPLDTNVVLRYLVEDPGAIAQRFAGVLPFFEKLERGERSALLAFKGLRLAEKPVMRACLDTLAGGCGDAVDAYLAALCSQKGLTGVFSFDEGLARLGVALLPVD